MKRFIDLGNQIQQTKEDPDEFAFYCTVKDIFETIGGDCTWESLEDFERSCRRNRSRVDVFRYISLIPEKYRA